MKVPSGQNLNKKDIELLKLMAKHGFIRWSDKPFTLKSGIQSHVYVFGREDLTDHPELTLAIGRKISERVHEINKTKKQSCLIGIPMAGIALATAASLYDAVRSKNPDNAICYRVMRQIQKKHGAHHNWVDGRPDFKKHLYITVDNVVTDGGSKLEAGQRLIEDGYPAKKMHQIIFVDRQQGAIKNMKKAGYKNTEVIFNLLDITYVYRKLGLWSSESIKKV